MPGGTIRLFDSGNPGPEAVVQINDLRFFSMFLTHGEIGFGEAYQHGLIDSPDLVAVLSLAIENRQAINFDKGLLKLLSRRKNLRLHRTRDNTVEGSKENIHAHYDLGNDFFKLFLDDTMTYSSAVFESGDQPLEEAQANKYRRLCELANVSESDRLLEIGSGWGGFAMFAAKTYGCHVKTITISKEQFELAKERIEAAGLTALVDIQLIDYRDLTGEYDKIVSIEMFEAVGVEYFETFFQKCSSLLKPGGRLVMQVITVPDRAFQAQKIGVNWIQKYIFPGGVLPSLAEMERVNAHTGLVLDSSDDIGADYAVTLHRWRDAFWANMDAVHAQGYDDYFVKTWDYYLAACEAGFLTRITGDVHIDFN
ncbi:MAG: cyclopropane-fatty-acyl-phospholipid synthase, partial [Chloroflexi bacterium]|nr:cyclopropane-fatty-acyl-phospholipid synthase [Chloroflexota bacterium]